MRKLAVRVVLVGSLAASAIGVAAGPASAAILRQSGCLEWNSTSGCVVAQKCSLDTEERTWACITYDSRTKTYTSENGIY